MTQMIHPDDDRLAFPGAISFEPTGAGTQIWRFPIKEFDLYHPFPDEVNALQHNGNRPAGVRIRFNTDATEVTLRFAPLTQGVIFDLYCEGTGDPIKAQADTGTCQAAFALSGDRQTVEIWLPTRGDVFLQGLELPDGATINAAPEDTRPKWIHYGSSISQCAEVSSSGNLWSGIVSRSRDLNLTCLAYGGNCHIEPMIGRLIASHPANLISLKVGINIYGRSSLSERTFAPALVGLIQAIRDAHPRVPLLVCSPVYAFHRETQENAVGLTIERMRAHIEHVVGLFQQRGDDAIHYINGLRFLDASAAELFPDKLHPSAEGYELLAKNFERVVFDEMAIVPLP